MLGHARSVPVSPDVVDVVGTGGDRSNTVNISTMASVVVAAAGVGSSSTATVPPPPRAVAPTSSRRWACTSISALRRSRAASRRWDRVLLRAGVPPGTALRGSAPQGDRHPDGVNVLGPLTNPARPRAGLIGCAFEDLIEVVAGVLAERGNSALVVRGDDGLDELTTSTTSVVHVVSGGTVRTRKLDPTDLGIARVPLDALRGGDAQANAVVARGVFAGDEGPVRDAVLLNAAGALAAFDGVGDSLEESLAAGLEKAARAIDSGAAATVLERWAALTAELAAHH